MLQPPPMLLQFTPKIEPRDRCRWSASSDARAAQDRPCSWRRPLVGERVEERVRAQHRLTVAVDLAVLAPHPIVYTRVNYRALGVGAAKDQVVACARKYRTNPVVRLNFTPASTAQPTFCCALQRTVPRGRSGSPAGAGVECRVAVTLTLWITPETWASPQPCLTCKAPTMSGQFWPPYLISAGLYAAAGAGPTGLKYPPFVRAAARGADAAGAFRRQCRREPAAKRGGIG